MSYIDCHEEPIHVSGHVQSYGYLIGLDAKTRKIEFYSKNISEIFSFDEDEDLLGNNMDYFADIFHEILDSPIYFQFNGKNEKFSSEFGSIKIKGEDFYFTIFQLHPYIYLEFEKKLKRKISHDVIYKSIKNINSVENEEEIWNELTEQIWKVTDFDRVMVYQLLNDGSGRVIAEKKLDNLPTFLNIYYPESDIPRQARALYLKNHKRIYSNVFTAPIPIISKNEIEIDLTYSNVRAMSPIHGQYLKNTGVASSFSTSIIVENQLWGLVTCHSTAPKHIDLYDRIQAEIFTSMSANLFMSFQSKKTLEFLQEAEKSTQKLKANLSKFDNLQDSLLNNIKEIKKMLDCDGMAVSTKDRLKTTGETPDDETIKEILKWFEAHSDETIYQSNEFLKTHGKELGLDEKSAGIMIISFPEFENITLLCFRKEFKEHINWAGIQEKQIERVKHYEDEKMMVSPRKSFEIFSEQVKGKSKMWSRENLNVAHIIKEIIIEISVSQFTKIQQLNKELSELNEELESFTYTVSHDLASPLTVMKLNAQLLEKTATNEKDSDKAKSIINEVDTVSRFLSDIMHFSRAKYSDIQLSVVEPSHIIQKVAMDAKLTYNSPDTEIIIGQTPAIFADETFALQVFQNVVGNAVKYSSVRQSPVVEIYGEMKGDFVEYIVKDNGIGISKEDQGDVFKIFYRSSNSKLVKGNGVGLHIVQRIMERIGGKISFQSVEDEGSEFRITFKKPEF